MSENKEEIKTEISADNTASEYEVINIARLVAAFEGKSEISLDDIYDRGLCPFGAPVKILGEGELSAAIKVEAHKFSQSAADKIRAAGGEVKELEVEGEVTRGSWWCG